MQLTINKYKKYKDDYKIGMSFSITPGYKSPLPCNNLLFHKNNIIKEISITSNNRVWIYSGIKSFGGRRIYFAPEDIIIGDGWDD